MKKRVFQAIDLLEDILQKRQTLVQKQKALRSARGAAMAAIMSRNTSHNVGSHVSPRATLERIEKRFEGLLTKGKELFDIAKELKGGLDRYIQEKTDFLAEVTTNPLASTRSARFYQDIILPFVENTLILDNIAANEGLGYEKEGNDEDPLVHRLKKNSLKIRVFIYDEEGEGHELKASYSCKNSRCEHGSFCYPEGLPYSMYCVDCEEPLTLGRVEGAEHDLEIAVPGPLGEHAFYGFLENHIRNAAKHNQQKLKGNGANLEIRIELSELSKPKASDPDREAISDKEAIFYQVRVLDNVSKPEKMVGEEDDVPLYEAINQRIDADIIEEDGSLKRTAWGIAEMKICATLLRGSRDLDRKEALCNEKEGVKSLRAVSTEKGELGYDLYLMKSRKLCAVTPSVSRDQSRKLRKQGIWVFQSVKQLEEELTKGQSAASFELALFDCASEGADLQGMKSLGELMPLLPFRVLVAEGGVNERDLGDVERLAKKRRVHVVEGKPEDWSQPSELLAWAWRNWIKRWGVPSENPVVVNIYLEQSCSESPTREWTQQADTFNETEDVTLRVWENGGECTQQTNADGIQIFYDRHGNGAMAADFDSDYVGKNAGVMLEKLSPDFTSLFNPSFPDVPNQWTFPWKLAEAGLLNVLVVDERIAEQAFERFDDVDALKSTTNYGADSDGPTLWHLAWGANIYICTHFGVDRISSNVLPSVDSVHSGVEAHENSLHFKTAVQLEKRDSTQKKREKRNAGILHKRKMKHAKEGSHVEDGEWMDEEEVPIDMILIHQGVLDTVCEDASFTQNDVLQTLQASVPFVIVESGRGIPHSLENHIKFIPFSRIQQVISDTKPAKLSLAQTGLSLNRKRVNRHE